MQFHASAVVGIPGERRVRYITKRVRSGDALTLSREPDNPEDPEAIAVRHEGRKIGYIPAPQRWLCQSIPDGDSERIAVKDLIYGEDGKLSRVDVNIAMIADAKSETETAQAQNPVVSLIGDELKVLGAVAKSAGRFSSDEEALIAKFAEVRCGELALKAETHEVRSSLDWLKSNIPEGEGVASAIESLKNPGAFEAMLEVSEIIVERGGPLAPPEEMAVAKIREAIAEKRARAA